MGTPASITRSARILPLMTDTFPHGTRPSGDSASVALPPTIMSAAESVGATVTRIRLELGRGIRNLIAGDQPPVRDLAAPVEGDPGLFGPDSVTWRVHADGSMLIGGIRALLLQMMHPLAMAGVAEHSDYRRHPDQRLARTSQFVGATTFGTTEQAEEAFAMVERVHRRVQGIAPDGRAYAANDPHLISWVHHAEVDSFLRAYQRFGAAPLPAADADRYVAEMAVVCERLGGEPPARSVAELDDYMTRMRPELRAGRQAREAARWLMVPPLPIAARPAYGVLAPAAVGLLPRWVRLELRLPLVPGVDRAVVQPAARTLVRTLAWAFTGLAEYEAAASADVA